MFWVAQEKLNSKHNIRKAVASFYRRVCGFFIWSKMHLCFLIVIPCINVNAQIINGVVYDKATGLPVSFVNVGVVGKGNGTVADADGRFSLHFKGTNIRDTLRISCIGYESESFSAEEVFQRVDTFRVYLQQKIYSLPEFFIRPLKFVFLGNNIRKEIHGSWVSDDLGSELGVVMKSGRKRSVIQSLMLGVAYADYDSLLFRINVYKVQNGVPGENILKRPIFLRCSGKYPQGVTLSIDLSEYSIIVNSDFLISFEWVKNIGQHGFFMAFVDENTKNTFIRAASQDVWRQIPHGAGMICKVGRLRNK
jgi:hypothetical protein